MVEAGGGITLPFDDFYYRSFFDSLDGLEQITANGGTITLSDASVWLEITTAGGSRAYLGKTVNSNIDFITWNKDRAWKSALWLRSDTESTIEFDAGMGGLGASNAVSFRSEGGKLYARTRGGGGETEVEVADWGTSGFNVSLKLAIVYTAGVKAEYYIDDALVATITTNLPTDTGYESNYFHFNFVEYGGTDSGDLMLFYVEFYQKL